jgi:tetraacyldisaccharide 4'-kinase
LREEIRELIHGRPVFESRMRAVQPIATPERVAAFCAVGNPESFFAGLRTIGYEVVVERAFADHHVYSQAELDAIVQAARESGATALITTAKDAVKLRTLSLSLPCHVLEIEIEIDNADAFRKVVLDRIYKIFQDSI